MKILYDSNNFWMFLLWTYSDFSKLRSSSKILYFKKTYQINSIVFKYGATSNLKLCSSKLTWLPGICKKTFSIEKRRCRFSIDTKMKNMTWRHHQNQTNYDELKCKFWIKKKIFFVNVVNTPQTSNNARNASTSKI